MQSERSFSPGFSFPIDKFLQNSSVVFYECSLDEDYPIVQVSGNVGEVLGYSTATIYDDANFWISHIHGEDREEVESSFSEILGEEKRTYVYRFLHGDGHYVWLRDENTVVYDNDGNPQAITGTAINISGQKKAEQEVRDLNQRLERHIEERTRNLTMANRKLKKQIQHRNKVEQQVSKQQRRLRILQAAVRYINDMVVISKAPVDNPLDSSIVYVNKAFERFTGYTAPEVTGRTPSFLHGEQTQKAALQKLNSGIKNHEHVRIEFINHKKDGTPYWVDLEMSPFPAEEDDMQYWVGVNRDISKRKKAEQALEENEERYRTYTELSFDAIFEVGPDGQIIDCNARACQLFGYSREELLEMDIKQLTPDEHQDSLPEQMDSDVATGSEVLQRTYKRKDGSRFPSEINTKIYHRNNEDHIVAYVRDISEHIAYEEAIRQSLREKSTLLAEVHHRVKNNLAVISGLLEMQTFNADSEKVINELRESQARIQSIGTVHELLYQSESFSDIDLDNYIDELVSYIAGTFGHDGACIKFEKNVEPISLTVTQAIPCGLLLNELITNAYKHAFPDGRGTIFITLQRDDGVVYLQVRDNGIGLPDDFDFKNSSSLGITLVNTLIDQLGGTFTIEKAPSACFEITFETEEE